MQSLRRLTRSIAPTDIPVLINGEAGTGKHILALYLHQLSDYRDEPLIAVDCHTVAHGSTAHLVRALNGNGTHGLARRTVLLENICELDLAGQKRLLDLLPDAGQETEENRLRARLISISRRRLDDDLREGKFIEKLYFRLNDVCLRVPPLRERKEDIPELTDFFLSKYGELFKRPAPKLSQEARARMAAYSWPGNIRQLENNVKEMVASGDVPGVAESFVYSGREQRRERQCRPLLQGRCARSEPPRGTGVTGARAHQEPVESQAGCARIANQLQVPALQIKADGPGYVKARIGRPLKAKPDKQSPIGEER